jgi:hypothetical protein
MFDSINHHNEQLLNINSKEHLQASFLTNIEFNMNHILDL